MAIEISQFEDANGNPVNVDDSQGRDVVSTRIVTWSEVSPSSGELQAWRVMVHKVSAPTGPTGPPAPNVEE